MRAIELFAGAGGLGMGVSRAGFHHDAVIEWNQDACDTLRENQRRGIKPVSDWPEVFEGDVRAFDFRMIKAGLDLVAGGPPCQPFSLGGKHGAHLDRRDMWPEAVRAVRELRPRAFIFENVRGLVRPTFAEYFEHIVLQLTFPEVGRRKDEGWPEHRARLLKQRTKANSDGLQYHLAFKVLNACNYGVPQRRERVFIVGFRSDLDMTLEFPEPTHTREALLWSKWGTGEYWDRHGVAKRARPTMTPSDREAVERMRAAPPLMKPWTTVRDALSGLPEPREKRDAEGVLNHRLQPGARPYPGHTGSPLDEPAKTLKAGDHGVPGGENMLAYPDGRVRYFTVRESARLQAFPDDYRFNGVWSECMRQIGNAVPVDLGHVVAKAVRSKLDSSGSLRVPRAKTRKGRPIEERPAL